MENVKAVNKPNSERANELLIQELKSITRDAVDYLGTVRKKLKEQAEKKQQKMAG